MKPRFVEIGAGTEPVFAKSLLEQGWEGYLIEAHPAAFVGLYQRFSSYEDAHLILGACSDYHEITPFEHSDDINHLQWVHGIPKHKDLVQDYNKETVNAKIAVTSFTLDTLFKYVGAPIHAVRLDIEAAEYESLIAYSFNLKPQILRVEWHIPLDNPLTQVVQKRLFHQGYKNVLNDGANVANDEWGYCLGDVADEIKSAAFADTNVQDKVIKRG